MGAMGSSNTSTKPYHHGNLKEALVDAAEALLVEVGINKLSLRAAARRSGVSQAAPYAHFNGRQDLLAAVGRRGFERLTAYLQRVERRRGCDSVKRTRRLGRAYVAFALDYPRLFRLMFGSELRTADDPQLCAACAASYAPLQAAVTAWAEEEGVIQCAEDASLAAWALVHGLAMLVLNGAYPWPDNDASRDALVDRVVSAYSVAALADSRS